MGHLQFNKTHFIITISIAVIILVTAFIMVSKHSFDSGYQDGNNHGYKLGNNEGFYEGKKVGDSIGNHRGDSIGFARGFDSKYEDILKIEEIFKSLKYKFEPSVYHSKIIDNVAQIGSYNSDGSFNNFEEIMNSINTELLEFLSDNFELNSKDKGYILASYNQQSNGINKKAYQHLVQLNKQTHFNTDQTIFSRRNIDGLNNFDEILGGYICDVVSIFVGGVVENPYSDFFIKSGAKAICPYVSSYAIRPYLVELKKKAIIKDYVDSEIKIKEQVGNQIAEFATAEVVTTSSDRFSYIKDMLIYDSEAIALTQSNATTKAGFDLMNWFELKIDHGEQEIIIQFPTPIITSHEVNTQFKDIDNGWFVKIKESQLNNINYTINSKLRNYAWNETNLYYDAMNNAEDLLKIIFGPISTSMPYPYTVKIRFGENNEKILIDHSNLSFDDVITTSTFKM